MTYPLAFHPGSLGRTDSFDGQFSIWNVAWVARTLVVDPLHVFDANIFYPHRWTLAYSEANFGAGILAIPAYWATRNPYVANNSATLLSFVLSGLGTYYLVRYLSQDRGAAVVSALCFSFCPYVFAHIAHIQLLMTAGLPFSMLAFHRLVDRPSAGRSVWLGVAMAAQAASCGYYAVFVMLMIGVAVLLIATTRGLWRDLRYWRAVALAGGVAIALVLPIFAAVRHPAAEHGLRPVAGRCARLLRRLACVLRLFGSGTFVDVEVPRPLEGGRFPGFRGHDLRNHRIRAGLV